MKFSLISPTGIITDTQCDQVILPTSTGQITILPKHSPLYTLIQHGEVVVKTGSTNQQFAVGHGFAKITGSDVSVLVDFGINAEDIDEAQVQAAKDRAEQIAANYKDDIDLAQAQTEILRSILQLKISSKRKHK